MTKNSLSIFFYFILFICLYGRTVNAQMTITATGTPNTFSVTYPANFTTLPAGLSLTFFSNQSITGAATLNVNGTGPRPLVKSGNVPLSSGDIKLGQAVSVIFDGTSWQLTSPNASNTANAWTVLGNNSDSTANYLGTNNFEPLIFSTNGVERMRISRSGRFGFNMNPSPSSMFSIKSLGNGAILGVTRSTDAGPLIDLTETAGGNARIDMYNVSTGNVVQIPSGPGNIFFAGGGNLGINTTSPGNTLHVQGGTRITNLSISGPVFANSVGDLFVNTTLGNIGSASANQLAYYTTNNSITGSNFMTWNQTTVGFNIGESNTNLSQFGSVGLFTLGFASTATGAYSYAFGTRNMATGNRAFALGNYVNAIHLGSFVIGDWSGSAPAYTSSSGSDEFTARFSSGYRFFTKSDLSDGVFMNQNGLGIGVSNPQNRLDVNGGARIASLSASGAVFANSLGDLFISTSTSNLWTVVGSNLQPITNTYNINLATSFGNYMINGNRMVSSNAPNVVFLGNAGSALNSGGNNLFYGVLAGSNNTSGNSNIFLGFQSGAMNEIGTQNIYLGEFSGMNATGNNNIMIGQSAGRNTTSAFNNVFIGSSAGSNNVTGGTNVVIGPFANVSLPGLSNAIAIGLNATVGGSNMMALGGVGSNAVKVGIGTAIPQSELHVVGSTRISNLAPGGAVFASPLGDLFVSTNSGASAWTISGTNIFPQNLASNVGIGLGSISTPGLVAGASRYLTLAANQTNTFGYPSFEMLSVNTSALNSPMSRMDFINVITPFSTRSNHARIAAFTGKSVMGHGQLGFYTSNGTLNEVMRLSENAGMSIGITFAPLVPPIHGLIVQGNVGIGTSAPGTNLDVAGGVRVSSLAIPGPVFATNSGDLYVNTTSGISGLGSSGGVAFWNTTNTLTANRNVFFWNNTTNRLGIGNANPQVALHISSDNTNNNVNVVLESSEASTTRGPGISMLRAKGTLAAPTAVAANDYLGGIDANGRTATQYNLSSSISFEVDGPVSGTSVPGRIIFSTTSSTGASTTAERMRINSNGNVGIGFTTPTARLHIKSGGNTAGSSALIIQNAVNTMLLDLKDNGVTSIGAPTTPTARVHVRGLGSTNATDAMTVENTAGTVMFNIQDDGNVGIGTITPSTELHISSTSPQLLITTNAINTILMGANGGTSYGYINAYDETGILNARISGSAAQSSPGDSYVRGRFGIGTNGPTSPLHVVGNARFYDPVGTNYSVNVLSNSGSGPRIAFSDATTSLNTYMEIGAFGGDNNIDNKARDFRIFSNATSATGFNILTNGRVGIGTLTPTTNLHVAGSICYTGTNAACSDSMYKTNVITLPSVLKNINTLRGVYYHWKTKEFPLNNFDSTRQIGVIAQELEKVYPELVITNDNGYKTVDYPKLSPILLQAIKEQQVVIDSLNRLLHGQKNEILQIKTESKLKDEIIKKINMSFDTQQKQLDGIQAEMDELKKRVFGEAKKP